jgi:hypothetical protein
MIGNAIISVVPQCQIPHGASQFATVILSRLLDNKRWTSLILISFMDHDSGSSSALTNNKEKNEEKEENQWGGSSDGSP